MSYHLVPTGSPRNLTVTDITPRSMKVQWIPPDVQAHHGIIIQYTVKVTSIPTDEVVLVQDTTDTSLEVSGLEPYSEYLVGVKAATIVGGGPFGEFIGVSTPEDGELIVALISAIISITYLSSIMQTVPTHSL